MALTINTNLGSINGQRNLQNSASAQSTAMQRLSSGLRVNNAKDDAAGLAIADRMSSQIHGMNVATHNANDGISLTQTAEGALGSLTDTLQRMRDLAVQSSSEAGVSVSDRAKIQTEYKALNDELTRIIQNSEFNGKKILNGALAGGLDVQVGATTEKNSQISVAISDMGGLLAKVKNTVLSRPTLPSIQTVTESSIVVAIAPDATVAAEAWINWVQKFAASNATHTHARSLVDELALISSLGTENIVSFGKKIAAFYNVTLPPDVWQKAWDSTYATYMESFPAGWQQQSSSAQKMSDQLHAQLAYRNAVKDYAANNTTTTTFTNTNATALSKTTSLVSAAISAQQLFVNSPDNLDLMSAASTAQLTAKNSIEDLTNSDPGSALDLAKTLAASYYPNDPTKTSAGNETAKMFFIKNNKR